MKYIHDGRDYVAWLANNGFTHDEVALRVRMRVCHAGHLRFLAEPGKVQAHGRSSTLGMRSAPFELPLEHWALRVGGEPGKFFISSNQAFLERLCRAGDRVEPAQWLRLAAVGIDEAVSYPALPNMQDPPNEYLVNLS